MGKQAFQPAFLKLADNKRKGRAVSIAPAAIVCSRALPARRAGAEFLQVADIGAKIAEE